MRRMIPYSVDITGNFVYSPQLIEARKQVQEGLLNAAQLLEIENKEIQHIVDTCKQIGLKCVTDGDYSNRIPIIADGTQATATLNHNEKVSFLTIDCALFLN